MVEEEYGADEVEARDAVLRRAASSMLCEARSSWAVMSSREKLEASAGLMVDAGDTRVLLLLLLPPLPPLLHTVATASWRFLTHSGVSSQAEACRATARLADGAQLLLDRAQVGH